MTLIQRRQAALAVRRHAPKLDCRRDLEAERDIIGYAGLAKLVTEPERQLDRPPLRTRSRGGRYPTTA